MNLKTLYILLPISFIGLVGGMLIGTYCSEWFYAIVIPSAGLTFILGAKVGDLMYEKVK